MSTIYLNQYGTEVSKDGGKIVIRTMDGKVQYIPSSYANCFVVMTSVQITYAVIMEVLSNGGCILYLEKDGRILGELGARFGRPRNLVRQLSCYMDPVKRQYLASIFVKKKLQCERNFLSIRYKSNKNQLLKTSISKISGLIKVVDSKRSIETLMGVEGVGAKTYFDTFPILLEGRGFEWNGRKKRPAADPMNAMLNLGYALLEKDIRRELSVVGLSECIGFLHEIDFRKDSLVYDVMEVFRTNVVDRFVFRCIGLNMIKPDDFFWENGRCLFNEETKKKFIKAYEQYVAEKTASTELSILKQIDLEVKYLSKNLRELTSDNDDFENAREEA